MDMVLNQSHFAGGQANTAAALDDAYKAFGVTKDSTDQEIKRAYRKLISQYHPDKLIVGIERGLSGKLLTVNALDMSIMRSSLSKDPACSMCGLIGIVTIG